MSEKSNDKIIDIDTRSLVGYKSAISPATVDSLKIIADAVAAYQASVATIFSQINTSAIQQQLRTIALAMQPLIDYQTNVAKSFSLALPDLTALVQSYFETVNGTVFQSQLQDISKITALSQLSLKTSVSVTHDMDGVKLQQSTDFDLRVQLDRMERNQTKMLAGLNRKPTFEEAKEVLKEQGMAPLSIAIKSAKMNQSELILNNHDVIRFEPNSVQCRLLSFFFSGNEKLKTNIFQFSVVVEKLEKDYWNMTNNQRRAVNKRYLDARRHINNKIKIHTAINKDFILLSENKELSTNKAILLA